MIRLALLLLLVGCATVPVHDFEDTCDLCWADDEAPTELCEALCRTPTPGPSGTLSRG